MPMGREDIVETEIPVSQLAIGMHVIRLDRPWEDTDFLLQGFILQTEEDVLAVQQQCEQRRAWHSDYMLIVSDMSNSSALCQWEAK